MRTHARAVVIGGGVVGVSTLYHLVKKGWSDSVLVERKELTSGLDLARGGPAAAVQPQLFRRPDPQVFGRPLPAPDEETGLDVGLRQSPTSASRARATGWTNTTITPASRRRSAASTVKFLDPARGQGHLAAVQRRGNRRRDPAPRGRLYPARRPDPGAGARRRASGGGEINRQTTRRRDRAPGRAANGRSSPTRARSSASTSSRRAAISPARPAAWSGLERAGHSGAAPIYRHRAASGDLRRARRKGLPEMGVLREVRFVLVHARGGGRPAARALRDRRARLLRRRAVGGQRIRTLSRKTSTGLTPYIETAIARVPAFGEVGIKKVYNGAIAYTPDGSPIVGPGAGPEEFLAQRRPFVRRHRGGRRRLATGGMDRRGRAERSTCSASIRAASAPMRRRGTSSTRTRRPTPRSSPCTIPTRSASPAGRCARRRATAG